MKFRPCIDLHGGQVKQIIGSTLSDHDVAGLKTNFASALPASHYAELYRRDRLEGGHVIMLGPGNEEAAAAALAAYPGGLQVGGGITAANAGKWLSLGACQVIVTSYVFKDACIHEDRLRELVHAVGKDRLVLDLSCRLRDGEYYVVTDRWRKFTRMRLSHASLQYLAGFCSEFLVHGVDVEGKCAGIDEELTRRLGQWSPLPATYAGGIRAIADLYRIKELGGDRLDATIGSALDIFGGSGIKYEDAVAFNRAEELRASRKD
jgi:phosphoribosylformimino-5-aminoimidazole carboxamide ribotide isomerase